MCKHFSKLIARYLLFSTSFFYLECSTYATEKKQETKSWEYEEIKNKVKNVSELIKTATWECLESNFKRSNRSTLTMIKNLGILVENLKKNKDICVKFKSCVISFIKKHPEKFSEYEKFMSTAISELDKSGGLNELQIHAENFMFNVLSQLHTIPNNLNVSQRFSKRDSVCMPSILGISYNPLYNIRESN